MHFLVFQHIAIEHPGIFRDLMRERGITWGAVPAYGEALDKIMGEGALERFDAECQANMSDFNASSRVLFSNFLSASGLAS